MAGADRLRVSAQGGSALGRGVEGMADTTSVAGAKSLRDLTVGGDVSLGHLLDERVDLGEKVHFDWRSDLLFLLVKFVWLAPDSRLHCVKTVKSCTLIIISFYQTPRWL